MKLDFSRLSKRERTIFYVSCTLLIALFFDRLVVRQIMNKMNKLNSEILIQERRLQRALSIALEEESITSEHKKYTKDIIQSASDEEEKSLVHSEIIRLARRSGVFLGDIKTSSIEKIEPYKRHTVEIEVESKIQFLADFIYQLEKSPQLLRVRDFHLIPKEKQSPNLKARLTITGILIISD